MGDVRDTARMNCEIVKAFYLAIDARSAADHAAKLRDMHHASPNGGLRQRADATEDHAITMALAAFAVAERFGWDAANDDGWYQWTMKAEPCEIVVEGLRRALVLCSVPKGGA